MNKTFNIFSEDCLLISPELEEGLLTAKLSNIDFNSKHPKGVYVVKFIKLKSNNTIFYNYIYYNELFTSTLLAYFFRRYHANNLLNEDIKNCLVFIDNNLCNNNEYLKPLEGIELNNSLVTNPLNSVSSNDTLADIFYYIFKLNYKGSIDDMVSLIKYDIEFKYFDVIKKIFKKHSNLDTYLNRFTEDMIIEFNSNVPFNDSFLSNCLIVCSDLDGLLSKFKESNLSINAGPQAKRGEVNSLNYFLSHFDIDYRNSLYYHYRHHKQNRPNISNVVISRKQFSFKNIHMNLGITRFYSTSTKRLQNKTGNPWHESRDY